MDGPSVTNLYPIKSENDQLMDSLANVASGPYPVLGGITQSPVYGGWNTQPQIQQSPVSEYQYAYGQSSNYATSTQQYADATMYHHHHQPQTSPTTDSSLRTPVGNPVSVPVSLSASLNSLGYSSFANGSSAQQAPFSTTVSAQRQQQQQNNGNGGTISRPPSIVHSPMNEAFSSRARSTSFPGPYCFPQSMHPNPNSFSSIPPSGFPQQQHPMARISLTVETTNNQNQAHVTKQQGNYYGVGGNGMGSPTSLEEYMQEDHTPTAMGMSSGNPHNQYRPITPGPGNVQAQTMYGYLTPPPQRQQHQSLPPVPPLATGGAGPPTIPRSMSMGNIPGNGTLSPSWFSGRNTPSGNLTPGPTLSLAPPALSRSTASRLGIAIPNSLLPGANFGDHRPTEYEMYPGSAGGGGGGGGGGGANGTVLSPLIRSSAGIGLGDGSGLGTTSNGGSVPITPTTDDTASFEYHPFPPGSGRGFTHAGSIGYADGADDDEDNDEEDEDDKMTMALPPLSGGVNGSPRRCVGVTRTTKKRRATTMAATVAMSRSRSGTMVNGASAVAAVAAAVAAGLVPSNGLSGGSLTMSPVDMHGAISTSMGLGMLVSSSSSSSPVNPSSGSTLANGGPSAGIVVGGQANSPLAMKELSSAHKPMIETFLNRYLNYLCMNPNAKDRMGHQIHQMYTARRIQRYEQLYGWRPLKFRIEAFVNGFVDLLTANGLSQDVTMKIPHYLNNSRLFSRFNESGNRMKSQGQTIWRVRARCRNDIPSADTPPNGGFHHHPPSAFSPQQQQQIHHQQQIQQQQQQVRHQQSQMHEATTNRLMMASDPLLWEFLPYDRSIVGQPPLAIVGTAWQWNMRVHDHWTPRKKVSWSFVSNAASPDIGTGSVPDGSDSSPPLPASTSSSSSNTLPKWLSLQGSKLRGTPTEPGVFPIAIEATFQDDNDPEPIVVRGSYTIQVSRAIGGWKTKVALPHNGMTNSPEGDHAGGSADMGHGIDSGSGRVLGGGNVGSGVGTDDVSPSLIGERMGELMGMHDANQGSTSSFQGMPHTYEYVH